jgi:hypothetical protein
VIFHMGRLFVTLVPMRISSTSTVITPKSLTCIAGTLFLVLLATFAFLTPLTFDDGYNATVALSFAKGRGYGTHTGGIFQAFNPLITTGAFFIAPFSLLLMLVGINSAHSQLVLVQSYSLAVTFLFFSIALYYAQRIHRHLPLTLIFLSAVFLVHGKTDVVPQTSVASLPSPPYGLWFQFLGNMSGTWALIAGITASVSSGGSRWLRYVLVFLCAAFACNAKMVHVLPSTVAFVTLCVVAPSRFWALALCGFAGIAVGAKGDTWLAWMSLTPEAFQAYRVTAQSFVASNVSVYSQLFSSPSVEHVATILATIPSNIPGACSYVGGLLLIAALGVSVVAGSLRVIRRDVFAGELMFLFVACAAAALTVILWWASMPAAPTRFLTSAPPLVVMAAAVAFTAVWNSKLVAWRVGGCVSVAVIALSFAYQGLGNMVAASRTGVLVRKEQLEVATLVRAESERYKARPLCGAGWWYPHEISFLTGSPKTIACEHDRATRVVVPKHIFPAAVGAQLSSKGCPSVFTGAYYDLALCQRAARNDFYL